MTPRIPDWSSYERHIIETYACPRCGAPAGAACIDVRVHRARKMNDPKFRARERQRSAKRPRDSR